MKIILKILAVVGLFILLASSFIMVAYASSPIYVDSVIGNDACNGTSPTVIDATNCPVKTIGQGVTLVDANGEVIVATGTYTENITINKNLTLQGAGAVGTIINGANADRVITNTAVVTISGVTITNGRSDQGGGILNSSTLNLNNSTVINNAAVNGGLPNWGGGILNDQGTVILSNTTVISNISQEDGGGIYNKEGTLTVISSTISYNAANGTVASNKGVGGGIANDAQSDDATLTVDHSWIINNEAKGIGGGGISNSANTGRTALVTVDYSVISDNIANPTPVTSTTGFGGGIRNSFLVGADGGSAILDLSHSTVSGNTAVNGGGIANGTLTSNPTLRVNIDSSTISGNTANGGPSDGAVGNGGGLLNQEGTMTLVNSTVSGNTATGGTGLVRGLGGGIANSSFNYVTTLWLTNTTIASNTATNGTGVANVKGVVDAATNFKNTIIAGNCYNDNPLIPSVWSGTLASHGHNLEYNSGGSNSCNLTDTTDITGTDPLLGPLQLNLPSDNDTETHALSSGSPAIDTGGCVLAADQRGQPRPNAVTTFCDIGAYESSLPGVVDLEIIKTVTPSGEVVPDQTITYTLTFVNNGWAGATGVVITDAVPSTLTNVTYTNSGATITATGSYTWTVQDLLKGEGGVITITGKIVSPTVSGVFTNTAIITTTINNPDRVPGSNESSIPVTVNGGSPGPGAGGVYLPIVLKNS